VRFTDLGELLMIGEGIETTLAVRQAVGRAAWAALSTSGLRRACGRRVAKLYGPGRYFVCRHCNRLSYASQNESALDRALRSANKIRQRLGGDPGLASQFPARPKGMWRRTYDRLHGKTFEIETRAEEAIHLRIMTLAARIDRPNRNGSFWK
jgi:hypothetical protein